MPKNIKSVGASGMDGNKVGLALGGLLAGLHALWALAVALVPQLLQNLLDWVFKIHFLEPYLKIIAFNIADAALLVIATFVIGYVLGWLFAFAWNWSHKKK
jgi:hypothetical protein